MSANPMTHPHIERLSAFALGQLESVDVDAVESHLASCETCCDMLKQMKEDTFVSLVRAARDPQCVHQPIDAQATEAKSSNSEAPVAPLAEAATVAGDQAAPAPVGPPPDAPTEPARAGAFDLPAELVNHPRYRIQELIGSGGMGAVYRAEHRLMQRSVALKLINPRFVANKQAIVRFRREVQAAAKLVHPNIVHAYDAEQEGDVHYLVMEYVQGTDLSKVLQQRGPLPVAEACDYIRQAALGLQHAHDNGMAHRDIKPQNLMVSLSRDAQRSAGAGAGTGAALRSEDSASRLNEVVKILDFGLAALTTQAVVDEDGVPSQTSTAELPKSGLTQAGSIMGTPDYMAPEQGRDAHSADIRSDIYSLGCTLYTLLTGNVPFPGGTAIDKVIAHSTAQPKPIGTFRKDVPATVVKVLDKMMAKDPAARYQTPAEVANALAPHSRNSGSEAVGGRRSRGALVATLGAIAAVFLAGIIYIVTDHGQLVIDTKVDDVQVVIHKGGREFAVIDLKTGSKVKRLPSGEYTLALQGNASGVEFDKEDGFTMTRWGQVVVKVTKKPEVAKAAEAHRVPLVVRPDREFVWADSGGFNDCDVTLDGRFFLAVSLETRTAKVWDAKSGDLVQQWGDTHAAGFTPDGLQVVLHNGQKDADYRVHDLKSGKLQRKFAGGDVETWDFEFSLDGSRMLSINNVNCDVWDFGAGKKLCSVPYVLGDSVKITPEGRYVLWQSEGNAPLRVYDALTGKAVDALGQLRNMPSLGTWWPALNNFSIDGKRLLAVDGRALKVLDIASGKPVTVISDVPESWGTMLSADGRRIVCPGIEREAFALWDATNGRQLATLKVPEALDGKCWVRLSREGETVLSALPSGKLLVFRLTDIKGAVARDNDTPARAIAPFDADQAKAHQFAWAKHLGGAVETTNSVGMKMRLIPPGEFQMGTGPDEEKKLRDDVVKKPELKAWSDAPGTETPQHLVKITKPYRISAHEVTVAQFRKFVESAKYKTDAERDGKGGFVVDPVKNAFVNDPKLNWRAPGQYKTQDDFPVTQVSWNDAVEFCKWLSKVEGVEYRLPTEAEWEFAARAGSQGRYSFSNVDELPQRAVVQIDAAVSSPAPVGSVKPNAFGLFDMEGNAWEWCADWFKPRYYGWTQVDPTGPAEPTGQRAHRGGAFNGHPLLSRPTTRWGDAPENRTLDTGFRVVMVGNLKQASAAPKSDRDLIQGTWTTQSIETQGEVKSEAFVGIAGITLIFQGDTAVLSTKRTAPFFAIDSFLGSFHLEPTKNPKTIDIIDADSSRKLPGLYSLEGDALKLCVTLHPTKILERPTELKTKPGTRPTFLFVLKRVNPQEPGWTQLFNGKDLTGWKTPPVQNVWSVSDGLLTGRGIGVMLASAREFAEDFDLRCEAKVSDEHFFHVKMRLDAQGAGYGIPIRGAFWAHGVDKITNPPALTPKPPANEWFTYEISARGSEATIKIKGSVIAQLRGLTARRGFLALHTQSPGTIQFRKIEIKELAPKTSALPPSWRRFQVPAGDFSVLLPDEAETIEAPIPSGGMMKWYGAKEHPEGDPYMVASVPLDARKKAELAKDPNEVIRRLTRQADTVEVGQVKRISVGRVQGHEMFARDTKLGKHVYVRLFVIRDNLAIVMALGDQPTPTPAIQAFLDSLTVQEQRPSADPD